MLFNWNPLLGLLTQHHVERDEDKDAHFQHLLLSCSLRLKPPCAAASRILIFRISKTNWRALNVPAPSILPTRYQLFVISFKNCIHIASVIVEPEQEQRRALGDAWLAADWMRTPSRTLDDRIETAEFVNHLNCTITINCCSDDYYDRDTGNINHFFFGAILPFNRTQCCNVNRTTQLEVVVVAGGGGVGSHHPTMCYFAIVVLACGGKRRASKILASAAVFLYHHPHHHHHQSFA